KLDLVDAALVGRLERRLAKLNPRAERLKTVRGAIDSDVLFATGVAAFRERARAASGHLHADGIGSFLYRSRLPLRQEAFERLLRRRATAPPTARKRKRRSASASRISATSSEV